MPIQFKHTTTVIKVLLFALVFSTPAFALDASDLSSLKEDMSGTMSSIKNMKEKLDTAGYEAEIYAKGMMKRIDTNDDNIVSSTEYMNYFGEVFDTLDANINNAIDEKEWVSGGDLKIATGGYSNKLHKMPTMEAMDTDDDHIVSRDEFVDFHQVIFEKADKKNSGRIKY
jgi:hypothetical protein